MTEFEQACIKEIRRVRTELQHCDEITSFVFQVHASGRIRDGEIEVHFGVGEYSPNVTASTVDESVHEYMRRKGWERRNHPLCLPSVEEA